MAANAATGGGIAEFPSGTYKSANSIHLLSNVTLKLDSGSTILAASGTGYDQAEANPNDAYQDYGHGDQPGRLEHHQHASRGHHEHHHRLQR